MPSRKELEWELSYVKFLGLQNYMLIELADFQSIKPKKLIARGLLAARNEPIAMLRKAIAKTQTASGMMRAKFTWEPQAETVEAEKMIAALMTKVRAEPWRTTPNT